MDLSRFDLTRRPTLGEVLRKEPRQERTKAKIEHVLRATEKLVIRQGVQDLTMNDIAAAAGAKPATLYDFFEDVEAVLLCCILQDADLFDQRAEAKLMALESPTLADVVAAAVEAFTESHTLNPAFVEIQLRHTEHEAITYFGRLHNREIAVGLLLYADAVGIATPELTLERIEFAVEMMDTMFQIAYDKDIRGDAETITHGRNMVFHFLAQFVAPQTAGSLPAPSALLGVTS